MTEALHVFAPIVGFLIGIVLIAWAGHALERSSRIREWNNRLFDDACREADGFDEGWALMVERYGKDWSHPKNYGRRYKEGLAR